MLARNSGAMLTAAVRACPARHPMSTSSHASLACLLVVGLARVVAVPGAVLVESYAPRLERRETAQRPARTGARAPLRRIPPLRQRKMGIRGTVRK
eukprot:gene12463-biopygen27